MPVLRAPRVKPTWPTRLGAIFLFLTLVVGMLAIVYSSNLYYLVVAMMLGFVAVSGLLAEYTLHGLAGRVRAPGDAFAGQPVPLALDLTNGKRAFPALGLAVRQGGGAFGPDRAHLAHLAAQETRELVYTREFARRGWHDLDGIWVATRFPFSLAEKAAWVACATRVLVYPEPHEAPPLEVELAPSGESTDSTVRGPGSTVRSLRDYVSGDPLRMIHWKRSARVDSLKIKEMEQDAHSALAIVLAPELSDDLERAVSLATGVLLDLERSQVPWSLATWSGTVPIGTGPSHLREALAQLALLPDGPAGWHPGAVLESARVVVIHAPGRVPQWAGPHARLAVSAGQRARAGGAA